jgi:hypothetical protein
MATRALIAESSRSGASAFGQELPVAKAGIAQELPLEAINATTTLGRKKPDMDISTSFRT